MVGGAGGFAGANIPAIAPLWNVGNGTDGGRAGDGWGGGGGGGGGAQGGPFVIDGTGNGGGGGGGGGEGGRGGQPGGPAAARSASTSSARQWSFDSSSITAGAGAPAAPAEGAAPAAPAGRRSRGKSMAEGDRCRRQRGRRRPGGKAGAAAAEQAVRASGSGGTIQRRVDGTVNGSTVTIGARARAAREADRTGCKASPASLRRSLRDGFLAESPRCGTQTGSAASAQRSRHGRYELTGADRATSTRLIREVRTQATRVIRLLRGLA